MMVYIIIILLINSSNAQVCQLKNVVPFLKIFVDLILRQTKTFLRKTE